MPPERAHPPRLVPTLALALALAGAGCSSSPLRRTGQVPKSIPREEVPAALERAERALAEGRSDLALEWAYVASRVEGLPTEERNRAQSLMERAADERVESLEADEGDPERLAELIDVGLPRHISVSAGIRAARAYVAQGEYKRAFTLLQRLDELYPRHYESRAAGALIAEIGIELSYRNTGWWIFGRSRPKAYQALEYLVLEHPLEPRCAEAYWRLGEMYEEDKKWATAIERLRELVLYHPRSVYVPAAMARIPHLRLASIESPEYDRKAILLARSELEEWLRVHPGHELEPTVREDLDDALLRLAQSDLVIARFYRTVGNLFGARLHAKRALELARLADDESRAAQAQELLERLGPESAAVEPEELLPEAPVSEDSRGEAVRD